MAGIRYPAPPYRPKFQELVERSLLETLPACCALSFDAFHELIDDALHSFLTGCAKGPDYKSDKKQYTTFALDMLRGLRDESKAYITQKLETNPGGVLRDLMPCLFAAERRDRAPSLFPACAIAAFVPVIPG